MNAEGPIDGPLSLYLHVPFCLTKCTYCDFNTFAGIEGLMGGFVRAIQAELRMWGDLLGHPPVSTMFLGGGTPSYLRPKMLGSVIDVARNEFQLAHDAEITAEANPDDITPARLDEFAAAGINRLSIGVQSFDDGLLSALGRRHSADQAAGAVLKAIDAGFSNLSIDLMYGLPGQSLDQWTQTVDRALSLGTVHLSAYSLSLEPGTAIEKDVGSGRLPRPDQDLAADMYMSGDEAMASAGLSRYEISNWCQSGSESRHNLAYWLNRSFLGVGPGAHSHLGGQRFSIIRNPRDYIRLMSGQIPIDAHSSGPQKLSSIPIVDTATPLDAHDEMAETMMLGLRLDEGVSNSRFHARFGRTLDDVYAVILNEAQEDCLVEWERGPLGSVRLSSRGRLLGNEVFSRFFGGER